MGKCFIAQQFTSVLALAEFLSFYWETVMGLLKGLSGKKEKERLCVLDWTIVCVTHGQLTVMKGEQIMEFPL